MKRTHQKVEINVTQHQQKNGFVVVRNREKSEMNYLSGCQVSSVISSLVSKSSESKSCKSAEKSERGCSCSTTFPSHSNQISDVSASQKKQPIFLHNDDGVDLFIFHEIVF